MKLETLLPLGKTDPGVRAPETGLNFSSVAAETRLLEELGYDGVAIEETKQDPFLTLTLAAQATERLRLATSVAIAFPRSPTSLALTAWTLQAISGGRFVLGLGSQVKGHIERRYGLKWSAAGPWMRDYIEAVRAVWDTWQNGAPLTVENDHYRLSLMVPLFDPGPIAHPDIPIQIAAVNAYMSQVAGEVADGIRLHPVCTPDYIAQIMIPAVRKGAAKTGRPLDRFELAMKPLVATAATQAELEPRIRDIRARVSFYASTPTYQACFEQHGLGDLARELQVLSRQQRWDDMPGLISDDVLHTYAVVGTYDEIARKLLDRFGDVVTSCEFWIAVDGPESKDTLRRIVQDVRGASETAVRQKLAA